MQQAASAEEMPSPRWDAVAPVRHSRGQLGLCIRRLDDVDCVPSGGLRPSADQTVSCRRSVSTNMPGHHIKVGLPEPHEE